MAYTAKTWKTGEAITATALNNLETGAQANADDITAIQNALPTYVGASVTKKAAATYTPGTSNQTIASGQYLSGAQTIKGDANLLAGNIKSGVSIFGVAGSYEGTGTGGIDTSDATAAADNIESGYTAYANGTKVTGTLERTTGLTVPAGGTTTYHAATTYFPATISVSSCPSSGSSIVDANTTITLSVYAAVFGDATAADVAAGKTFTSAAGLKVTGTAAASGTASPNNCEAYHVTATTDTVNFQTAEGDIKVWGYGAVKGTYTTTIYAFVGDGYYSGATYGTPSKTTATFGLNTDGTLSGLPSGLTALDVIVTRGV